MVAQREQNVVVELLEAARAVGADDHALEVVVHVHGDGHEGVDLRVGGLLAVARRVLADDLVALHHAAGEALGQRALARVALEAEVADQVEVAVAVGVALGEQHPPLGAGELDGHLQHQLAHVAVVTVAAVHRHHLLAQLARPLALGAPGALGAQAQLALLVSSSRWAST